MSYTIETIAERMGARRVGTLEATVDLQIAVHSVFPKKLSFLP